MEFYITHINYSIEYILSTCLDKILVKISTFFISTNSYIFIIFVDFYFFQRRIFMRKLEISELSPGMIVAENIMTLRNDLLYPAGYRLTQKAITKLRFYSIPFICIEDENDHFSREELKTYSERVRSTPEFQLFAEEFEKDVYKFKGALNDVVEKNTPIDINDLLQDTLALLHTSSQNVHI